MIENERGQSPKVEREEEILSEYEAFGMEPTNYERHIAGHLVSILENTELPRFEIVRVTSTSNDVVKAKAEALFGVLPAEVVIPEKYRQETVLNMEKDSLLEAPWVNLIHGWTKVLNYMNTISAVQRGEMSYDPQVMAAITRELYLSTTASDPNPFLRTDERYSGGEFAETKMRKAGTRGVNSSRHITYGEMKFILDTIGREWGQTPIES
jgi:hypothetical protein